MQAVPGVCRQAVSTQTTLQIKGLGILSRGPEVSNWRQKPFASKRAQCNAVMLLAQLHQVGNRDGERKKKLPHKETWDTHPTAALMQLLCSIPACSAVPNPPGTLGVLAEGNLGHSKVGGKLVAPHACCCWLQEPRGECRSSLGCRCPGLGERIESHSSSL